MQLLLVAQQAEALTGTSGWAGAGLLGLVLSWVFLVHLPAKDKQLRDMLTDSRLDMAQARADFRAALDRVTEHCEQELKIMTDSVHGAVNKLRELVTAKTG